MVDILIRCKIVVEFYYYEELVQSPKKVFNVSNSLSTLYLCDFSILKHDSTIMASEKVLYSVIHFKVLHKYSKMNLKVLT